MTCFDIRNYMYLLGENGNQIANSKFPLNKQSFNIFFITYELLN